MTLDPKTLNEIEVAIRTGQELASAGEIDAAELDAQLAYMGRLLLDHGESLLAAIPRSMPDPLLDFVVGNTLRRVAELPDRSSPADWPDAMLVTAEELDAILRDELLAAIPRWRPIETAPRDGAEILGYDAHLKIMGLMSYERESVGVTRGMWATTDGGYQRTPTHWMPLPAAPKEESNG